MKNSFITVIGAGLAGCETAQIIARAGVPVRLIEMKPQKKSPAHESDLFAELVCSNSLKAERLTSAAGLLKAEMQLFGSLCVESAYLSRVPAGGALAVDRELFSSFITKKIRENPLIEVVSGEAELIPDSSENICVVATGPLTSDSLAADISRHIGEKMLSFYDAAAPIVTGESVDPEYSFAAARYGRGDDDYINCPMDKEQYTAFYRELVSAECALPEKADEGIRLYEGCMPIERMAKRGEDTIRFGPLKPVGLTDPKTGRRPYAVVQLRQENADGKLFNLVGFQTNLKFGEQKRVFSMIPALHSAEFMRYGVMHRNTFIDSPRVLKADFSLKSEPNIFFAGQITGVEGYMESAASGILAGINAVRRFKNDEHFILPRESMMGALAHYISDESVSHFQPMGANFGILPSIGGIRDKQERYAALSARAIETVKGLVNNG